MSTIVNTSLYGYSGQDPMLRLLAETALEASPWLLPREDCLAIDWERALEALGPRSWPASLPDLLTVLNETVPEIPIEANIYKSTHDRYLDQTNLARSKGHKLEALPDALPPDLIRWFERFREIADRLLYCWEEICDRHVVVRGDDRVESHIQDIKDAQLICDATHVIHGTALTYPIRARIYLGAKLLPGDLSLGRGGFGSSSEICQHHLALASAQMKALRQVWTILWSVIGEEGAHGVKDLRHQLQTGLKSPAMRRLYQANRDLTSTRILPNIHISQSKPTLEGQKGLARIEKFFHLIDARGCVRHRFASWSDTNRNELPYQMRHKLAMGINHVLFIEPRKRSEMMSLQKEISRLGEEDHQGYGRPLLADFGAHWKSDPNGTSPWSVEALNIINGTIDDLIAHSPFLLLIASGILSAYPSTRDGTRWGWALHPFALALGLSPHIEPGAWPGRFFYTGQSQADAGDEMELRQTDAGNGPEGEKTQETSSASSPESSEALSGSPLTTRGSAVWSLFDRA